MAIFCEHHIIEIFGAFETSKNLQLISIKLILFRENFQRVDIFSNPTIFRGKINKKTKTEKSKLHRFLQAFLHLYHQNPILINNPLLLHLDITFSWPQRDPA